MIKATIAAWLMVTSLALGALALPTTAAAQVEFSITFAPPPLPVYEQPPIPAPGYLWLPGYWSYGPYGYFWVPGTWMQPPAVGLLWTPGYWGWSDGFFVWNAGYWAPQIGFYGGVNYGFGYPGRGFEGGYWRDNRLYYNTTVNNISNVSITNVYSKTVVNDVTVNRVSYVGGPGGLTAKPTADEERVAHEHRIPATAAQTQHREAAAARPELVASVNHGKPPIAATSRPNEFTSHVVGASHAGGPVMVHAQDLPKPPAAAPAPKPASNPNQARDYQQQQSALEARQQQEREALAQMQERDHAYMAQQNANERAMAAMEHQHRQQTQYMQQRQAQEMQAARAPPPHAPAPHGPPSSPPPRGEPQHH